MQNWNQRRWLVVAATFALVLVAFLAVFGVPWGGADVSDSVTDASLKRLNPGMTTEEVRTALGAPLVEEAGEQGRTVWRYSRPVKRARWYPDVAVLFDGGRLAEVFVERRTFWGVDTELRYWMKPTGERWTVPGFSTTRW